MHPLIDRIARRPEWSALLSALKAEFVWTLRLFGLLLAPIAALTVGSVVMYLAHRDFGVDASRDLLAVMALGSYGALVALHLAPRLVRLVWLRIRR